MEIPFSRSINCSDCGTKKKSMRFKQKCGLIVCLNCQSYHPDKCGMCLEKKKSIPIMDVKLNQGIEKFIK